MILNIDINKMKEVFGDEIEDIINENIDIVEKNIEFLKELKFEDAEGMFEMYPELFMNFPKKFEEKILKLKEELGHKPLEVVGGIMLGIISALFFNIIM